MGVLGGRWDISRNWRTGRVTLWGGALTGISKTAEGEGGIGLIVLLLARDFVGKLAVLNNT